jgi:hypothetical protein
LEPLSRRGLFVSEIHGLSYTATNDRFSPLMPRRSRQSSGTNTNQILGLVGGLLFILVVGAVVAFLLLGDGGAPRRSNRVAASNDFSLRDYLDNANSLRGNTYRMEGRVEEQLRWTRDRGRLLSLVVEGSADGSPVPVWVPQDFSHLSIEKNTKLSVVAEVGDNGLLVARDVRPQ